MSDHRKSENHEGIYHDEHLRGNKSEDGNETLM
jgi:hypothetical protein